jgi:hypothetical protein
MFLLESAAIGIALCLLTRGARMNRCLARMPLTSWPSIATAAETGWGLSCRTFRHEKIPNPLSFGVNVFAQPIP